MKREVVLIAGGVAIVLIVTAITYWRGRPKRLKPEYYKERWQELQKMCSDEKSWPLAIIDADKLLDQALKRRKYKGKSEGERLTAAQHELTDNEAAWYGHKLCKQIVGKEGVKLTQRKVKDALIGIKLALKDLGAL